jgi:TIR domain
MSLAPRATELSGGVFICYRREDSSHFARLIYDRLQKRLGPEKVFIDVDNISFGVDFAEDLSKSLSTCDVLVAIIGKGWLSATDKDNRRRIDDPRDFVRIEIEAALNREVRVIPVLIDGATAPEAEDLPDSLKRLTRRQGIEISHNRFESDVEHLIRALDPRTRRRDVINWRRPAAGLAALVFLFITGGMWYFWPRAKLCFSPSISSQIVSRIHGRDSDDKLLQQRQLNLEPQFQELFYEWTLTIKARENISNILLEIAHAADNDLISTIPDDSNISLLKPRWMSGFQEPTRVLPDFFVRTISIDHLGEDQAGSVVLRRPMVRLSISPNEIIKLASLQATNCFVQVPDDDATKASERLTKQAIAFSKERFGASAPLTGLPIGRDLGDLQPGQIEGSMEAIWDDDLKGFTIRHMESRENPRRPQ